MVFLTLHMAYWRWGRSMWTDTDHVTVRIFRISQVATPLQYANNESRWSPGYNGSLRTDGRDIGGNEHWLHDNTLPVNFATLTLSFFAISAVFHLWALLVGIFERTWSIYWRCAIFLKPSPMAPVTHTATFFSDKSTIAFAIGDGWNIRRVPV